MIRLFGVLVVFECLEPCICANDVCCRNSGVACRNAHVNAGVLTDMHVFRVTRVRLRGHLEACGAGDPTVMDRCEGALVEGMWGCGTCSLRQRGV
jgi:hypothetical protein